MSQKMQPIGGFFSSGRFNFAPVYNAREWSIMLCFRISSCLPQAGELGAWGSKGAWSGDDSEVGLQLQRRSNFRVSVRRVKIRMQCQNAMPGLLSGKKHFVLWRFRFIACAVQKNTMQLKGRFRNAMPGRI